MRHLAIALWILALGCTSQADAKDWNPGRYMEGENRTYCEVLDPNSDLAKHPVVAVYVAASPKDVIVCRYPFDRNPAGKSSKEKQRQTGWVVLADPPVATLIAWIKRACEQEVSTRVSACREALQDYVSDQSGGQFPVIGFVAEGPSGKLCKQYGIDVKLQGLISFQDGVTVQRNASSVEKTEGIYCATDGWGAEIQQVISMTHFIAETYSYARLSGLHRSCAGNFIDEDIKTKARQTNENEWLIAVRQNHLDALKTGRDRMMDLQAQRFYAGKALSGSCF